MTEKKDAIEGWAILELMGHRRLGGYVREHELGGHSFVRIDVPASEGRAVMTQFYSPPAIYCLTPAEESTARAVAALGAPVPVQRWEIDPARTIEAGSMAPGRIRTAEEKLYLDEAHADELEDDLEAIDAELEAELEAELDRAEAPEAFAEDVPIPKCLRCVCTDLTPCETNGGPCAWIKSDLCSACVSASEIQAFGAEINADNIAELEGES